MEILASVVTKIGKSLVNPVGRQFGYLIYYGRNTEKLKDEIDKLEALRKGLQGSVNAAKNNGEEIRKEVQSWMEKVDAFLSEARKFLGDVTVETNKKCFSGLCPDLVARYKIGKNAVKRASLVIQLQEDGKFSIISHPSPPLGILYVSSSGNFIKYKTNELVMMKIMEALKDEKTNFIGVHGMGGVGKTTLVTEIGKQVKEENLFDEVVMSVVSQNFEYRKIQGQIADMLGLKLTEESDNGRANRIKQRLKGVNKVLVILDDVWLGLNIASLGIPLGDEHKGCKVIVTTRRQQIFRAMDISRETTKVFQLGVLSDQESWDLLRRNAGDVIELSSTIKVVATEISKECRGLPIAIVTVGRALRDKDLEDWKEAAGELKKAMPRNIEGVEENVYRCIKLSYDYLRDEEAKLCFLLCSLFPEDYDIMIESLVRYGIGLRVFKNVDTIEEARSRTNSLIKNLIASCLLLERSTKTYVKMHDVVRDVAISIFSNEYFIRSGVQLAEWPDMEHFESYIGVSLMCNDICQLPIGLKSGNLQILLLQNNKIIEVDEFFEGLKSLRVLDMSGVTQGLVIHKPMIDISKSLCNLTCLHTLILDSTDLSYIDSLGQIRTLEILSLKNSLLSKSANVLSQLTSLKVLDMSQCKVVDSYRSNRLFNVIESHVLQNLSRLEELYLFHTQIEQKALADLNSLGRLSILVVSVTDPLYFPKNFGLPNCQFSITSRTSQFISTSRTPAHRTLLDRLSRRAFFDQVIQLYGPDKSFEIPNSLVLDGRNIPMEMWVKYLRVLFKRTNHLSLAEFEDIKNILPFLLIGEGDDLNLLKTLGVSYCNGFEYLIDAEEWGKLAPSNARVLCNLEELDLIGLDNLKAIWHAGHKLAIEKVFDFENSGLLQNLRVVKIESCSKLKSVFQISLAQHLRQLEILDVSSCEELEEIVAKESEEEETVVVEFKNLRELSLGGLPKLDAISKSRSIIFEWPSLNEFSVRHCPKMKNFIAAAAAATSQFKTSAPNLKKINLDDSE